MQKAKPFIFLLIVAASIAAFYIPDLASHLVFDRRAILNGEWWRLFSCHFVHFSFSHMLVNLTVIFLAYGLIRPKFQPLEYLLAGSIILIGPALFACDSQLAVFGGSSGLASAALFFVFIDGYKSSSRIKKTAYCAALLICIVKTAYEFQFATKSIFLPEGVQTVPLSHLLGYCTAVFIGLLSDSRSSKKINFLMKKT